MNQTKKRLSIIKLAISITDLETIQLQSLKLSPLQSDVEIQDILTLLASDNFAQAQSLISHYIEYAPEEVVQRTHINVSRGVSLEDQAIIDEFQLIVSNASVADAKTTEVDINEFLSYIPEPTQENLTQENLTQENPIESLEEILSEEETSFEDSSLSVEENDYSQAENSLLETSTNDDFFASSKEASSNREEVEEEDKDKDDFFKLEAREEETELHDEIDEDTQALFSHVQEEAVEEVVEKESLDTVEEKEASDSDAETEGLYPLTYEAMSHISLKLIDMKRRYPAIQKTYEKFEEIENLIIKISQQGYSEEEIQNAIESTKTLISNAQYTQAAQLLLVCAATESKFAQFMLARELYVGSVLSKNIPESFALMSALAIDDYPEALCDLGQFYENGIATKVDTNKAEELYKGALDAGIQRANKHYSRLTKGPKSFFKA